MVGFVSERRNVAGWHGPCESVAHDGWEEWRVRLIQMLEPDHFEEPPPAKVVQFLERIAKKDPDSKVRRTAGQALKYFKLRWGVEGKKDQPGADGPAGSAR